MSFDANDAKVSAGGIFNVARAQWKAQNPLKTKERRKSGFDITSHATSRLLNSKNNFKTSLELISSFNKINSILNSFF
jgi:hypothetical protein